MNDQIQQHKFLYMGFAIVFALLIYQQRLIDQLYSSRVPIAPFNPVPLSNEQDSGVGSIDFQRQFYQDFIAGQVVTVGDSFFEMFANNIIDIEAIRKSEKMPVGALPQTTKKIRIKINSSTKFPLGQIDELKKDASVQVRTDKSIHEGSDFAAVEIHLPLKVPDVRGSSDLNDPGIN